MIRTTRDGSQASILRRGLANVACLATLLVASTPLGAQQLGGTVRDSVSQTPISGVVLLLLDSSGKTLARNITNDHGEYTVALPASVYRIRFLHIGFRPQTARVPEAVGSARLDVVMSSIPTLLEPVSIVEQPNCPRRDDGPTAFSL